MGDAMAKKGLKPKRVGVDRNDLCSCGSGKKYKNCCKPVYHPKTDEELAEEKRIRDEKLSDPGMSVNSLERYLHYMRTVGIREDMFK